MHGARTITRKAINLPLLALRGKNRPYLPFFPCTGPATRRASSAMAVQSASFYPHGLECVSPETSIEKILARLGPKFQEVPLEGFHYVQPASILYEIDGKTRSWEIIKSHASVGVVLYHVERDAFLLVRQFRPAVYATRCREAAAAGQPQPPRTAGFTVELCAGLVDKAKPLTQIVVEEIAEECGYNLAPDQVLPIGSAISSAGTSGSEHAMFFALVREAQRASKGGGLEQTGEAIEVLALPFGSVAAFLADQGLAKSPGLMYGLLWAQVNLASGALPGRAAAGNGMETEPLMLQPVLPS